MHNRHDDEFTRSFSEEHAERERSREAAAHVKFDYGKN